MLISACIQEGPPVASKLRSRPSSISLVAKSPSAIGSSRSTAISEAQPVPDGVGLPKYMLIDSHAHLSTPALAGVVEGMIARAVSAGVKAIVNIATTKEELVDALELQKRYPMIHVAGATTPHDVEKLGESDFEVFAKAAQGALIAVGETGLDYHYEHSNREVQQKFCRRYIELALATNLPLVFHCREAFFDLFKLLDDYRPYPRFVLHCFTGTLEEVEGVIERGGYISMSGIVTFKKSIELQAVAARVPLDRLLIETDTPYLAPQSRRGKQNEPAYLVETATFLAALRKLPLADLASATTANTRHLFGF